MSSLSDWGFFSLTLALSSGLVALVSGGMGWKLGAWSPWVKVGERASFGSFLFLLLGSLGLWYGLAWQDYSLGYVARHSSHDLSLFYRLSAFWAALEGSHLLWTLFLSFQILLSLFLLPRSLISLKPPILVLGQSLSLWMIMVALVVAHPFDLQLPQADAGMGLNPLLQNPYMAIHPPILFAGYTGLALPFLYAWAGLMVFPSQPSKVWLSLMKFGTLYAWSFLTLGIVLGGRWAYAELGWAGYWAWDPVENASLLPWLLGSSLIHLLILSERYPKAQKGAIALSFLGVFMTYVGTFITRSGIVSSIHSFAQSQVGPFYFVFLVFFAAFSIISYYLKAPSWVFPPSKPLGLSRDSLLGLSAALFFAFFLIVLLGTLYPIISEAFFGVRLSVQAPYFNTFFPYFCGFLAWLLGWAFSLGKKKVFWKTLSFALLATLSYVFLGKIYDASFFFYGALFGIFQVLGVLLQDLPQVLSRPQSHGSFFAHVGFLFLLLGFLGPLRSQNISANLEKSQAVTLGPYELTYLGFQRLKEDNVLYHMGIFSVKKHGSYLGEITPSRAEYPTDQQLFHEVGIRSFWNEDLYGVLNDFDYANQRIHVQFFLNPNVNFVWLGAFLMALGGFLSCFFKRRKLL